MRVVLHVDSLVLRGFRPEERHAIAAGLQGELMRLFAAPAVAQQWIDRGSAARVRVPPAIMPAGATPDRVGAQIARSVVGAWKR